MTSNLRQTPLTCSGHTRPVVFLAFSEFNSNDAANYYCISACKGKFLISNNKQLIREVYCFDLKCNYFLFIGGIFPDGKPMLRQGDTGDWIGTFEGHKGAVWGKCT